jgi:DNA (cytosine-5)-methyltransferase 1
MVQTPIVGRLRRRITPREAARLQSFPENFIINSNEQKAFKQFGNSANVEIIKILASQIVKI